MTSFTDLATRIAALDPLAGEQKTMDDLRSSLENYINHLILHDFPKLVNLLYRIDVSEKKLKLMLEEKNGVDAAGIIAGMIIERELEKIKSRKEGNNNEWKDE